MRMVGRVDPAGVPEQGKGTLCREDNPKSAFE